MGAKKKTSMVLLVFNLLLAGTNNATMGELMAVLFSWWSSDPTRSEKLAYSKIAMGLLDTLAKKLPYSVPRVSLNPRKHCCESASHRFGENARLSPQSNE